MTISTDGSLALARIIYIWHQNKVVCCVKDLNNRRFNKEIFTRKLSGKMFVHLHLPRWVMWKQLYGTWEIFIWVGYEAIAEVLLQCDDIAFNIPVIKSNDFLMQQYLVDRHAMTCTIVCQGHFRYTRSAVVIYATFVELRNHIRRHRREHSNGPLCALNKKSCEAFSYHTI